MPLIEDDALGGLQAFEPMSQQQAGATMRSTHLITRKRLVKLEWLQVRAQGANSGVATTGADQN